MVRIRLVRMSGSHMTLRPRKWPHRQPRPEGIEAARRAQQQRPIRREVGVPIGRRWELQFYWY